MTLNIFCKKGTSCAVDIVNIMGKSERSNSSKRLEGRWVMKYESRDIVYMHVQASERFVITSGMSFREFASSLEKPLNHVLLLKHDYDDTEFNLNVSLDYVTNENVAKLVKADVRSFGNFSRIIFKKKVAWMIWMEWNWQNYLSRPYEASFKATIFFKAA